jgi:hypothetical protein
VLHAEGGQRPNCRHNLGADTGAGAFSGWPVPVVARPDQHGATFEIAHVSEPDRVLWSLPSSRFSSAAMPTQWPKLRQLITDRLGARILLYVNPFLTTQPGHDDQYQFAKSAGYLVKNQNGDPYQVPNSFVADLVDLSNPNAFECSKVLSKTA